MKMNITEFFKTEFGAELECTVKALDINLEEKAKIHLWEMQNHVCIEVIQKH